MPEAMGECAPIGNFRSRYISVELKFVAQNPAAAGRRDPEPGAIVGSGRGLQRGSLHSNPGEFAGPVSATVLHTWQASIYSEGEAMKVMPISLLLSF